MSNPALRLAEILASWAVEPGKTVHQARGSKENAIGRNGAQELKRAVVELAEVEKLLDELRKRGDDVSDYELSLPAWYTAVFLPDTAWNQGHSQGLTIISPKDLAALRILGRMLEIEGITASIGPTSLEEILAGLNDLEATIADAEVDELVRHRLIWHLHQARAFAQDVDRFGASVVIHTSIAVANEAYSVADDSADNPALRDKLRHAAGRILAGATENVITRGVLEAAPHLAQALGTIL